MGLKLYASLGDYALESGRYIHKAAGVTRAVLVNHSNHMLILENH
jgi:hypothetical protein